MPNYWEKMRDIREDHNLNQSDIAQYLGTTQQQYSYYELGKAELPLRHAFALCELYHISLDELLGFDCNQSSNK